MHLSPPSSMQVQETLLYKHTKCFSGTIFWLRQELNKPPSLHLSLVHRRVLHPSSLLIQALQTALQRSLRLLHLLSSCMAVSSQISRHTELQHHQSHRASTTAARCSSRHTHNHCTATTLVGAAPCCWPKEMRTLLTITAAG